MDEEFLDIRIENDEDEGPALPGWNPTGEMPKTTFTPMPETPDITIDEPRFVQAAEESGIDWSKFTRPATPEENKAAAEWFAKKEKYGRDILIEDLFNSHIRDWDTKPAEMARRMGLARESGIPENMLSDPAMMSVAERRVNFAMGAAALRTAPESVIEWLRTPGMMEISRDDLETVAAIGEALAQLSRSMAPDKEGGMKDWLMTSVAQKWDMDAQVAAMEARQAEIRAEKAKSLSPSEAIINLTPFDLMISSERPNEILQKKLAREASSNRAAEASSRQWAEWIRPEAYLHSSGGWGLVQDVTENMYYSLSGMPLSWIMTAGGGVLGGPLGASAGAMLSGFILAHREAKHEQAGVYHQLVTKGMDDEEAYEKTYREVYLPNVAVLTGSNWIQNMLTFGAPITPVGPGVKGWVLGTGKALLFGKGDATNPLSWWKRWLNLGISSGMEGVEEISQGMIEDWGLGQEHDWNALLYEGFIGTLNGLAFSAGGSVLQSATSKAYAYFNKDRNARAAQTAMQHLDNAVKAAEASEVLKRTPDAMKDFVRYVSDNNVQKTYMDAEVFMQSVANAEEAAERLGIKAELDEALSTGGDVEIGTDAIIANPEIYENIRNDLRMTENGMSNNEREEHLKNAKDVETKLAQEMTDAAETVRKAGEEAAKVQENILAQLEALGQKTITKKAAELASVLYTAGVVNEAQAAGISITEMAARPEWNIRFQFDREAKARTGENYDQSMFHGTRHNLNGGFDLQKIGSGEGAQVYGHGIYLAEERAVGENYRTAGMPENEAAANRMRNRLTFKFDNKIYRGDTTGYGGWVDENGNHPYGTPEYNGVDSVFTMIEMNEIERAKGNPTKTIEEIKAEQIKTREDMIERYENEGDDGYLSKEKKEQIIKEQKEEIEAIRNMGPVELEIAPMKNPGNLYTVEGPENDVLLDYDIIRRNQPDIVKEAMEAAEHEFEGTSFSDFFTGSDFYNFLSRKLGSAKDASMWLNEHGIPGLRYLDNGSRNTGEGTHNFVIWDTDLLKIMGVEGPAADVESYAQSAANEAGKITRKDIQTVQAIPGKSVNDFTSEETQATETWARKFWRELKTKSPFFRAWFGDWRANDKTPVKTATVKGTKADMKKGEYRNDDTQWDIRVSNRVFGETVEHSKKEQNGQIFIDALGNIDEIIKNAVLLDSVTRGEPETDVEKKRKIDYAFMHSLYAVIQDKKTGAKFLAKLFVNELYNQKDGGTERQAYELRGVTTTPLAAQRLTSPNEELHTHAESSGVTVNNVSDLFALVKQYDKDFHPKEASKVTYKNGKPRRAYHGTGRADRVGSVFRKDRATSGPMAFFTDARYIAENYARDKADTSLSREDANDYHKQFTVEVNGNKITISDYWRQLSPAKQREIAQKAEAIGYNDDEEIALIPGNKTGSGGYEWNLREARGNHLDALVREWLDSGTLYNREEQFLKVLELAGVEGVTYNDPNYRQEAVYPVFLNLKNPLVTTEISDELFNKLGEAAEEAQRNFDPTQGYAADGWDKTSISPEDWMDKLTRDRENGTTYAWTVIPDWVTEALKKEGYDGIKDLGGKGGGPGHTVYIPFESEQVKSATDNRGTFDASNPDIYMQGKKENDRGYVEFREAETVIHILKNGDRSTLIHELGHVFLNSRRRLAQMEGVAEFAKNDWATLAKWLEIEDIDFSKPLSEADAKRWKNAHEKFAAGFEKYVMDGTAPSNALAKAFRAFRKWLTDIYKAAKNIVYVDADGNRQAFEINDDVKAVMDRMLASEEEIEQANELRSLGEARRKLLEAGLPDDIVQRYSDAIDLANDASKSALLRTLDRETKEEYRQRIKELREQAKGQVEEEMRQVPRYKTALAMKERGIKLSLRDLTERYGLAVTKELPRGTADARNGIQLDMAAELLGYGNADALIEDLKAVKQVSFSEAVKRAVDNRIMSQESALFNPDAKQAAVDGALHVDEQLAEILARREIILEKMGRKFKDEMTRRRESAATMEAVKDRAEQIIRNENVGKAGSYRRWLIAEQRNRQNANAALDKAFSTLDGRKAANETKTAETTPAVAENIRRGTEAMEKVISEQTDVMNAMHRDDVGDISFIWGEPGRGEKFKGGKGISHIIAHRDAQGYDGQAVARKMVEVIAKGEAVNLRGNPGSERIDIVHDGYTAVLSLYNDGQRQTWLLTGWEDYKKSSDASSEGDGSTGATLNGPMLARPAEGAEVSNQSLPQTGETVNKRRDAMKALKAARKYLDMEALNHALVQESMKARDEISAGQRYVNRLWKNRKSMERRIGAENWAQIRGLMERFGFWRVEDEEKSAKKTPLSEWAAKLENGEVSLPETVTADGLKFGSWKQMTQEQFSDVIQAAQIIEHVGRNEGKLLSAQEYQNFAEAVALLEEATNEAHGLPGPQNIDPNQKGEGVIKQGLATLTRVETIIRIADGLKEQGAWWKTFMRPVQRSNEKEIQMGYRAKQKLDAIFKEYFPDAAKFRKFLAEKLDTGIINPGTGEKLEWTGENLLAAMLNWGNQHNRERLVYGNGFVQSVLRDYNFKPANDAQYYEAYNAGKAVVETIFNRLGNNRMWEFCQEVWDMIDEYWPEIKALEEKMTSIAPEKVEATPVRSGDGRIFRGGYYPVKFDRMIDWKAYQQGEKEDAKALYENQWQRAGTRHGHTKERVERIASRPLSLKLDVIGEHLSNVIHDLAYRETIRDLNKLVKNDRVRELLTHAVGKEAFKQINPWIQSLAAPDNVSDGADRFVSKIVGNVMTAALGMNIPVRFMQLGNFAPAVYKLGLKNVLPAMRDALRGRVLWDREYRDKAFSLSTELKDRLMAGERDLRRMFGVYKDGKMAKTANAVKTAAMFGLGWADMIVAMPIWYASYDVGLKTFGNERQAIDYADQITRLTNNTTQSKDRAAILRGNSFKKLFTMFYNASNTAYNLFSEEAARYGHKGLPGRIKFIGFLFAMFTVQSMIQSIVKARAPWNDDDWDEKDKCTEVVKWMLQGTISNFTAMFPIIRDIAGGVMSARGGRGASAYRMSPMADMGEGTVKAINNILKFCSDTWDGKETKSEAAVRDALTAGGYVFGLPTPQLIKWYRTFLRWSEGAPDFSPLEWIWAKGGSRKKKR